MYGKRTGVAFSKTNLSGDKLIGLMDPWLEHVPLESSYSTIRYNLSRFPKKPIGKESDLLF